MIRKLANVSLAVRDYDEAIQWFTDKLGLELRMDGSMGGDYRFVTVGVHGQDDVSIVLHKPLPGVPCSAKQYSRVPVPYRRLPQGSEAASGGRCEDHVGTGGAAVGCSGCFRGLVWQHTRFAGAERGGLPARRGTGVRPAWRAGPLLDVVAHNRDHQECSYVLAALGPRSARTSIYGLIHPGFWSSCSIFPSGSRKVATQPPQPSCSGTRMNSTPWPMRRRYSSCMSDTPKLIIMR